MKRSQHPSQLHPLFFLTYQVSAQSLRSEEKHAQKSCNANNGSPSPLERKAASNHAADEQREWRRKKAEHAWGGAVRPVLVARLACLVLTHSFSGRAAVQAQRREGQWGQLLLWLETEASPYFTEALWFAAIVTFDFFFSFSFFGFSQRDVIHTKNPPKHQSYL